MCQVSDRNGNPGSLADAEWSIALEQFIATTLTGQPIVDFFNQKVNIVEAVSYLRKRRFTTIHSLADLQWQVGVIWLLYIFINIQYSMIHC